MHKFFFYFRACCLFFFNHCSLHWKHTAKEAAKLIGTWVVLAATVLPSFANFLFPFLSFSLFSLFLMLLCLCLFVFLLSFFLSLSHYLLFFIKVV